jgi:hypothetical protein
MKMSAGRVGVKSHFKRGWTTHRLAVLVEREAELSRDHQVAME